MWANVSQYCELFGGRSRYREWLYLPGSAPHEPLAQRSEDSSSLELPPKAKNSHGSAGAFATSATRRPCNATTEPDSMTPAQQPDSVYSNGGEFTITQVLHKTVYICIRM